MKVNKKLGKENNSNGGHRCVQWKSISPKGILTFMHRFEEKINTSIIISIKYIPTIWTQHNTNVWDMNTAGAPFTNMDK